MQSLRRMVQFCLGIQALGLLGSIFLIVPGIMLLRKMAERGDVSTHGYGALLTLTLIGPVFGTVPTIAWWFLKQKKRSARSWTMFASVQNIFILLVGIQIWFFLGHTGIWPFYAWSGFTGILGLVAFWRGGPVVDARLPNQTARVVAKGDGRARDYVGQGASIGIVWLSNQCWSNWAAAHHLNYPELLFLLVQVQIALLLATFGHELGHLGAGWASRKILRSFHVGPVRGEIRDGKWRFDLRWRQMNEGSVAMVAPDLVNMRSRKAFSIMGGPAASLLIGSLCIVATLLAPGHAWQPYWMLFAMVANFSLAGFCVNLIPLKPESLYADGAQLYQVITYGPWAHVHFAFAMVSASTVSPLRARDFDVAVIDKAADAVPNGERGLQLRLFACFHYLDAGNIPEALITLQSAEALWEQSSFEKPEKIVADFVFVNAFYKRDLASAERWWWRNEALPGIEKDAGYWRARTALLWLKGERKEAWDAWKRGDALAQKLPAAGAYDGIRSHFAKLKKALEEASVAPALIPRASLQALAAACEESAPTNVCLSKAGSQLAP